MSSTTLTPAKSETRSGGGSARWPDTSRSTRRTHKAVPVSGREEAADEPSTFQLLYPDAATLREKIETIALRIYGARGVEYDALAARQLDAYEKSGFGRLPVCIAKTHLSISSDPKLKGAPTGWVLPVREVRASVGAGFIYPICGDMRTMPGLPTTPIAASIDIDVKGNILGLS